MSNVLVTGGRGFVGHHLVDNLVQAGHKVYVVDNCSSGQGYTNPGAVYWDIHTVKLSPNTLYSHPNPLRSRKFSCLSLNEKIDYVYHLGEYSRIVPSFDAISTVWESNSMGTLKVLEFAKAHQAKIIYAGSSTRFASEGVLHSPYTLSKSYSADLVRGYGQWYGVPYTICYFYNVFGPGYNSSPVAGYQSVVSIFEEQWKAGQTLTICGDGRQRRAFTYVEDVVRGLQAAATLEGSHEFQLTSEKQISILELARLFVDDARIEFHPARPGDRAQSHGSSSMAKELLGWEPTVTIQQWVEQIKNANL